MQHLIDVNILKIFVPESGVREDRRIYEAIMDAARAHGLAQIAVSRGMAGHYKSSRQIKTDLLLIPVSCAISLYRQSTFFKSKPSAP